MTDQNTEPEPVIIRFSIDMDWDARGHHVWYRAPDDWPTMAEDERKKFLEGELETWRSNEIETTYTVYQGHEAARAAANDLWGAEYSEDQLEELW